MLDLETPTPTDEGGRRPVRVVALVVAAAVVIAIALVVIGNHDPATPADQPSPTVTVPSTVAPKALFATPNATLRPGTYSVDTVDGTPTPRILITLSHGWINTMKNWGIFNAAVGFISFSQPDRVYNDACHAPSGYWDGRLDFDGMVAAIHSQSGWLDVTAPVDASIDGYPAMTFQRTAPADFTGCDTGYAQFRGWDCCGHRESGAEIYYEPNEIETIRVLDLDGTIVVISGKLKPANQTPAAAAQLAATINSIRIEAA